MNPSRLFIERPIATLLLMVALTLSGLLALRELPISSLPEVDYPIIQVNSEFPGAGPDIMTRTVTAPLERQLGRIAGLNQMLSVTSGGASNITLKFNLGVSLDIAEQEVQAAINTADSLLPSDLPNKPTYKKVNPADTPILTIAATSDTLPMTRVQDLVNTRAALRISQVDGVGLVSLSGGQQTSVRIRVNPEAIASHGLSLSDIDSLIAKQNVNASKGGFDGPNRAITIETNDQLKSAKDYAELVLRYESDNILRLKDVATIEEAAQNSYQEARVDGKQAIVIHVQRQPGTNVVAIAERIKALLPSIQNDLPGSVQLSVISDRTESIRSAIHDVELELLLSIALVVAVSYVFLRTLAATFIPGIAVPLSIVGTFGIMYFCGFSLNNLTLMALTIATGFVIDDAIVVVENIERHIEEGMTPFDAAIIGAKEIGFTIISLTVSLIAVLIPLLFMGDIVGRLFREFSITLAVAIFVSMCISLTLTPMLSAHLLHPAQSISQSKLQRILEEGFNHVLEGYRRSLEVVFRHQKATLTVAILSLAVTAGLYLWVSHGFFPTQDTSLIQGITQADKSVSFGEMSTRQNALAEAIQKDPAVSSVTSIVGIDSVNNVELHTGRLQIVLKPHAERDRASNVIARIQEAARQVPGIELFALQSQDLNVDDQVTPNRYQFTLMAQDRKELEEVTERLCAALKEDHRIEDVHYNLGNNAPILSLTIDRNLAARYGVTASDITTALYNAYGQRLISTIYTQANQYRVVLEVSPKFRTVPEDLDHLYIIGSDEARIPLTSLVKVDLTTGHTQYTRLKQSPAVTVSLNLTQGVAIEQIESMIQAATEKVDLPDTVTLKYQGTLGAYAASSTNTLWLILAAIVTMYIVLGILYESLIHPVTVLSTLPSAAIGALLALKVFNTEFDLIALIGVILLIGIVKKNAIMLIDFAIAARRAGKDIEEAARSACLLRLRPILMTTCAALFGAVPLLLASGAGSELRHPMGLVIIAGLLLSQLITLYTTPVIYIAFERLFGSARKETV